MLDTQSCPTLCDPMGCSPPGSSVHGILQARILEWVAIPFSSTLLSWLFISWLFIYQPCSLVSDHLDDRNLGLFTFVSNTPNTVPFTLSVFSMYSNELQRLGFLWRDYGPSWSKSLILQMVKLREEWTCSRLHSKFVVEQKFLPPNKPSYLAKMD